MTLYNKFKLAVPALLLLSGSMFPTITSAQANTSIPASATYAFTRAGQHPDELLVNTINQAHSSLDIAIYSITKYNIVDAIVAAKKRGVNVRIITDRTEARNRSQARELAYMERFGIPIKENTHAGLMHLKLTVVDDKIVAVGSFNYTESASTENDEVLAVLHDPAMAKDFAGEFDTMWNDTWEYATID